MKRRFCFILVVAIYMTIFSGCTNAADSKEDSDYRTIVDMAGREVIIPKKIERISCMTSAACETAVVAMGQASKLVCTTSYVDGNFEFTYKLFPELARVEKANAALSKEELINRNVDLVIIKNKRDIEKLTGTGIPVVYLEFNDIEQTKESIKLLGEIFDAKNVAEAYISYIETFISVVQERLSEIPTDSRVTTYASLQKNASDSIFYTYAPSHISTEIFDICQTSVITKEISLSDNTGNNGSITEEALINKDPDVIFLCGVFRENGYKQLFSGNYAGVLSAVDNRQVYYYPIGMFDWSVGGFELGISCLWLAQTLYPNEFQDIDIIGLTQKYYNDTAGVELTYEEVSNIFEGK